MLKTGWKIYLKAFKSILAICLICGFPLYLSLSISKMYIPKIYITSRYYEITASIFIYLINTLIVMSISLIVEHNILDQKKSTWNQILINMKN